MRTLSPHDYGKLALIISFFVALLNIAHFNIGTSLSKFLSESKQKKSKDDFVLFFNALILIFITSSFSSFVMILLLKKIKLFSLTIGLVCILGFFLFSTVILCSGVFRGFFNMKLSAINDILSNSTRFIFVLLIVILGFQSLKAAIIAYLMAGIVPIFFSIIKIKSLLDYKYKYKITINELINFKIIKKIMNFSKYLTLASFSLSIMWFFSRWVLTRISYESVAFYDGAMLIYSIFQIGFASIVVATVPYISYEAAIKKNILNIKFPSFKKIIFLYLIMLVLLGIIKSSSIDQKIFYSIGLNKYIKSLPLFYLMFFAAPVDFLFGISSGILQGLGKTKELFIIVLSVLPIHIIGTYFLVTYMKEQGAAIMFVITYIILSRLGYKKISYLIKPSQKMKNKNIIF